MTEENHDQGVHNDPLQDEGKEAAPTVSDPGELEGLSPEQVKERVAEPKKKEKDHTPPEGSKRWNEIYRGNEEGKRQVKELGERIKEGDAKFDEIKAQNEGLAKSIKDIQSKQEEQHQQESDTEFKMRVKELRGKRDAALGDESPKDAARFQDEIDDAMLDRQTELRKIASSVAPQKEDKEEGDPAVTEKDIDDKVTAKLEEEAHSQFKADNPWFDPKHEKFDPAMTGAARAIDEEIEKGPRWNTKPLGVQYAEVKRRVETRFGYTSGRISGPSVGGVDGGGEGGDEGETIRTPEQVDVARGLFPGDPKAEEYYAEQLKLTQRGG